MPSPLRRHPRARNRRSVEPFEESGVPPCLPPLTPPEPQQESSNVAGGQSPCNSNAGNDDGLAGDSVINEAEANHSVASRTAPPRPSLADQSKNTGGKHPLGNTPAYVTASTTSMEARRGTDSSSKVSAKAIRESNSLTSSNEADKTDLDLNIATTPSKDVAKSDASFPSPTLMDAVKSRKGIALGGSKSGIKTNNDFLTTSSKSTAKSKSANSENAKNAKDIRKSPTAVASRDTVKTDTSNPTTPSNDTAELESDHSGNLSHSKGAANSKKSELAISRKTAKTSSEDSVPTKYSAKLIGSSMSESKNSSVIFEKAKHSEVGSSTVSNDSKDPKSAKISTKRAPTASTERESTRTSREDLTLSSGSSGNSTTADGSKDSQDRARRSTATSTIVNVRKDPIGPADLALTRRSTRSSSLSTESTASKETKDSSGAPSDAVSDQVEESTNKASVSKDNAKSKTAPENSPSRKSADKTDSVREKTRERRRKGAGNTDSDVKDNGKGTVAKDDENMPANDAGKSKNEGRKSTSKPGGKIGVEKTDMSSKMSIGSKKVSGYSKGSEEKLGDAKIGATEMPPTAIVNGGQTELGHEKNNTSQALSVAPSEDGPRTPFNFDRATSDSSEAVTTMMKPPPSARKLSLPAVLDDEYLLGTSMNQPADRNTAPLDRTKSLASLTSKQADKAPPFEKATANSETSIIFRRAPIDFDPPLKLVEPLFKNSYGPLTNHKQKKAKSRISGFAPSSSILKRRPSLRTTGQAKGLNMKQQNQVKLWKKENSSEEESDKEDEREPIEKVTEKVIVTKAPSLLAERIHVHVELEKDVRTLEMLADKAEFRDNTSQQENGAKEVAQRHTKPPASRTSPTHPQLSDGAMDQVNESGKNFSKFLEQIYTPKVPPPPPVLRVLPDQSQSRQPKVSANTGSIADIANVTKLKRNRMDTTESVRNFFAKRGSASDRLSVSVVQGDRSPSQRSCAATHAEIAEKAMELFEMLETAIRQRRQQQHHQKQQQTPQQLRTAARNSHSVQRPVQPNGFSSVGTFVAPLSSSSSVAFSGGMISQAALQQIDFEEVSAEDLDDDRGTAASELSGASVPSNAVRASGNSGTCIHFRKLS